jgi:hypothetical protein
MIKNVHHRDMKMNREPHRRRTRFAAQTKGIRLRVDQVEALERVMQLDPELDFSKAVRRGVDLFLAERAMQIRQATTPTVFQNMASDDAVKYWFDLGQKIKKNIATQPDTYPTPTHSAESRTQSAKRQGHSR